MPQPYDSVPVCSICGQRPGVARVMFQNGSERTPGAVCEVCARQMMQGGVPGFGAMPGVAQQAQAQPSSETPALDGFGRDLTAEAAEGRIDPVIGRTEE